MVQAAGVDAKSCGCASLAEAPVAESAMARDAEMNDAGNMGGAPFYGLAGSLAGGGIPKPELPVQLPERLGGATGFQQSGAL